MTIRLYVQDYLSQKNIATPQIEPATLTNMTLSLLRLPGRFIEKRQVTLFGGGKNLNCDITTDWNFFIILN